MYAGIVDEKTKKPLFRAEALKAVRLLRTHIASNCIGDPPDIPLYFEDGKDSVTDTAKMRCVRGTNDLEGFHRHMLGIMAWCTSPRVVQYQLLEHGYRWNLRMEINNRGLNPDVGGFYDQPVIEATQVLSLASTMHCRHCFVSTSMSRSTIITQNLPLCFFNIDGHLAVSIVHGQRMTYQLFG